MGEETACANGDLGARGKRGGFRAGGAEQDAQRRDWKLKRARLRLERPSPTRRPARCARRSRSRRSRAASSCRRRSEARRIAGSLCRTSKTAFSGATRLLKIFAFPFRTDRRLCFVTLKSSLLSKAEKCFLMCNIICFLVRNVQTNFCSFSFRQ